MPPKPSRFTFILRSWGLIWLSICLHWEALKRAVHLEGLAALGHPRQIQDAASAKLLSLTSANFIAYENTTVVPSLVQAADGVVLELGPGPGNQIHRFDTALVKRIYGIEPNPLFEDAINAKLEKHNLRDKYKLIACGVEDSDVLREEGITEGSLDAVLCIQVLCAVKDPKSVMKEVWKLLKPGGKFIFWEHGSSRDHFTNALQACWNPIWSTFVGCHLTRSVVGDILNSGEWENPHDIEELEEPYSFLPRTQGVLVKKKD
ncbi:methyltransferase type 11 [Penicillium longicatenatum]|uniref:methyltransferase type 11 n=1 Tax=Penicillium longicatenatum TaxID=1561947 RepID=UPI0025480489|nr:methyltransferase type 11 [Penicillium longicatenatum]KAJ5635735.1 methyltransferase type 11 [Penicillium longicatenatum]